MCGRYYFDDLKHPQLKTYLNELKHEFAEEFIDTLALKEVFPSNNTIVLIDKLKPTIMKWGFKHWKNNSRIINAKSETYKDSYFFNAQNIRPCIIPASGYFEWDKNKKKHYISSKEELYIAGFYNQENEFVILTKEANETLSKIHDRMPVLLNKENALKYLKKKR